MDWCRRNWRAWPVWRRTKSTRRWPHWSRAMRLVIRSLNPLWNFCIGWSYSLNRNLFFVAAALSLWGFGEAMFYSFVPIYLDKQFLLNKVEIGWVLGAFGLSMAITHIPAGRLADRWGRRPVLVIGLALFALGSLGCGLANDIYTLIIARILQGSGAVGSVALAALADFTRPTVRTQAFTITGIAIDTPSIDPGSSKDFKVHQALCNAQKLALENIANLDKIPESGAMLYVIPMFIKNGTGAPARVFAELP